MSFKIETDIGTVLAIPCPSCNCDSTLDLHTAADAMGGFQIQCKNCGYYSRVAGAIDDAVKYWNRAETPLDWLRADKKRPTFNEVYMQLASIISARSTCIRRQVGCVITSQDYRRVLSIGYNGNAAGLPNMCDDSRQTGACGCLHAEENAVISCNESFETPKIVFTTVYPCKMCAKRLIQLGGVKKIYFAENYRNVGAAKALEIAGIPTERIIFNVAGEKSDE